MSETGQISDAKRRALGVAIKQIEKQHGKGAIMRIGADGARVKVEAISTGSLSLDAAIGVGGIPKGRITEIFGPESSGKTTVCLHAVANCQANGGIAAFIDAEHAVDLGYARKLGVDVDNLLISQPDNGEQALEIAETLIRSGAVDLVVIDSVAALVPRAELEGEMGDSHVGLQARLMSQALRKITGAINRSSSAVVFTNQIREKIGVMFGNPETTTGGRALKFYASLRLDIRRIGSIKDKDEVVANKTKVKVVKNKVAPPFKQVIFPIRFNEGVDHPGTLIEEGTNYDLVTKSGSWYSYGDIRLGQGSENSRAFLLENTEVAERLEKELRVKMGLDEDDGETPAASTESEDTAAAA